MAEEKTILPNDNSYEAGISLHRKDTLSSVPAHTLPLRKTLKKRRIGYTNSSSPSKLRVNNNPTSSFCLHNSNNARKKLPDMNINNDLNMERGHILANTSRMSESEILSVLDADFSEFGSSSESSENLESGLHLEKMECIPIISRNRTSTSQEICPVPAGTQSNKLGDNLIEKGQVSETRQEVWRPSQPNFLELSARKMTKEIMRYEIRLSGLYGRMSEMKKENQELRESLKLISERNVDLTISLWKRSKKGKADVFCIVDSENEKSANVDGGNCHAADCTEGKKNKELLHMLTTLKRRLNKRVKEYSAAQKNLRAKLESYNKNENTQKSLLTEESPLIKDLRSKLTSLHNELKLLRESGNIRVENLKGALHSEKSNRMALYKKLEESQLYITDSSRYVTEAAKHLKLHQQTIENQRKKISMLQKKVSAESLSELPLHPIVGLHHNSEKYDTLATEHNALLKLVQTQKSDITILNELLDEEKLKNKALLRTMDSRDKRPAPSKSSISQDKEDNNEYENLSQKCLKLLNQQALDRQKYRDRIQEIHKLYREILNNKDCEHQTHMSILNAQMQTIQEEMPRDTIIVPPSSIENGNVTDTDLLNVHNRGKSEVSKTGKCDVHDIELAEPSD